MRVLYDIAVLGEGFYQERAKTGVYRAIDGLGKELIGAGDCEIYFSALDSLRSYSATRQFLLAQNEYDFNSFIDVYGLITQKLGEFLWNNYNRHLLSDKLISLYFRAADLMIPRKDLPARFDLYHSTFFPLPDKSYTGAVKRFITIYDLIPLLYPHLMQKGNVSLIRKVVNSIDLNEDFVLCISESTKNDLCNFVKIDPSRVFVSHLAADKDIFYMTADPEYVRKISEKYNLPEEPYFLSLGTLEPRKNIAMVIRAFSRLVLEEKLSDVKLVLVGTRGWDYDHIFMEAEKYNELNSQIIFTGYVPDKDLAGIYSGALAFLYPSLYEGFGLPPLEAMQCGVPVVTSNSSSLPEVVGDAGILVDPHNEEELCQGMLKIMQSGSLRDDLVARSLKRARQFSWGKCARDTVEAYKISLYY